VCVCACMRVCVCVCVCVFMCGCEYVHVIYKQNFSNIYEEHRTRTYIDERVVYSAHGGYGEELFSTAKGK
jgi:hypothetical protein